MIPVCNIAFVFQVNKQHVQNSIVLVAGIANIHGS